MTNHKAVVISVIFLKFLGFLVFQATFGYERDWSTPNMAKPSTFSIDDAIGIDVHSYSIHFIDIYIIIASHFNQKKHEIYGLVLLKQ